MTEKPTQTSREPATRSLAEAYYNTWGSWGQHSAQHYIFCTNEGCYDEVAAHQSGHIELMKKDDKHSSKNYHYYRVYAYDPGKFAAVIKFSCFQSSSSHDIEVRVIAGNARIDDLLSENKTPLGYLIEVNGRKYVIGRCAAGFRVSIQNYEAYLEKEKQKKERPRLVISYGSQTRELVIGGDTYHHRETLKQIARSLNARIVWDGLSGKWRVKDLDADRADVMISEIKKAIPTAEIFVMKA